MIHTDSVQKTDCLRLPLVNYITSYKTEKRMHHKVTSKLQKNTEVLKRSEESCLLSDEISGIFASCGLRVRGLLPGVQDLLPRVQDLLPRVQGLLPRLFRILQEVGLKEEWNNHEYCRNSVPIFTFQNVFLKRQNFTIKVLCLFLQNLEP